MARVQSEGSGTGIGPTQAADLAAGGALLVDVREVHEWVTGHAPIAVHIPVDAVADKMAGFPRVTVRSWSSAVPGAVQLRSRTNRCNRDSMP